MNRLFCILISFFFICTCKQGYTEESINSLINEALKNNPKIQVVYNSWKAAEHKIKVVKSLPDPAVSYTYFGESIETRLGPQEHKYGISQKIPFPGKLGFQKKAQQKQAEILKKKYEAQKREIIKNIKFICYDIFWVDKAIEITEQEKSIFVSLEKVVQRKYEANRTPQQDVVKLQVELTKMIDRLIVLRQNRKSLIAKLNSILNRTKSFEFGRIENLEIKDFAYNLEELRNKAQFSRQELILADFNIKKSEYEKTRAKLNYFPDFTFGFNYIQIGEGSTTMADDGQNAWMGMVKVNVPIWFGKLSAQVKEKQALLEASKKNQENIKNIVKYEIEDLYYKLNSYREISNLYENALMPQAQQAFEAAKSAYETGKVDFLNWLDAERVLLQTRLASYRTIVDYRKALAYLERVVGREL